MFDLEVVRDSLKVSDYGVHPTIQITIRYKLPRDSLPLDLQVCVFSEDKKFISQLIELPPYDMLNNPSSMNSDAGFESKINSIYSEKNDKSDYNHVMIFSLNEKILDYVEEKRTHTKNNDVILLFSLNLTVLRPSIRIAKFDESKERIGDLPGDISYDAFIDSKSEILVRWDKDGIENRLFLKQTSHLMVPYLIPSSTWINDFQPRIGLGTFLIVEIPILTSELNKVDDNTLDDWQKEFKMRIEKALSILKDIDIELKNGEWGEAVKDCRDAIEPFKKNYTAFIKEMIFKTTGMDLDSAMKFTMCLDNIFDFTSNLHHQVNKSGKLSNYFTVDKEDAYMIYMITAGLINSLSRKFIKITSG